MDELRQLSEREDEEDVEAVLGTAVAAGRALGGRVLTCISLRLRLLEQLVLAQRSPLTTFSQLVLPAILIEALSAVTPAYPLHVSYGLLGGNHAAIETTDLAKMMGRDRGDVVVVRTE